MNVSYQTSLVNRHIRRFTGILRSETYYERGRWAERVHRQIAEIFHIERPGPARPGPTVTLFRSLYLLNRAFDPRAVFFAG